MKKKLQRKFVLTVLGVMATLLTVLFLALNLGNAIRIRQVVKNRISLIEEQNGEVEDVSRTVKKAGITAEFAFEVRYFTVLYDVNDNLMEVNVNHIAQFDTEMAVDYAQEYAAPGMTNVVVAIDKSYYDIRRVVLSDGTDLVIFLDCTQELTGARYLAQISLGILIVALFIVWITSLLISGKVVEPIVEAVEKQKMFITNAGHELKTPLAVISANTEVLEMAQGENEWTKSTMNQVKRLSRLVNNLITMARMEEDGENLTITDVNVSDMARETADSFEAVMKQAGKQFTHAITENLVVKTDASLVQELMNILLDNATKYCDDGGTVQLSVMKEKRSVDIIVSNDYKDGKDVDYGKFFDRFYRADTSHNSKKSGFGIGLSMARQIVGVLKGRIRAEWNEGKIYFIISLDQEKNTFSIRRHAN